jgi:periplasmic protein CpxP/Spy
MIRVKLILMSTVVFFAVGAAGRLGAQEPNTPRREVLEQRLRQRTGEIVRNRLKLTDDQMKRLQASNRQFEPQRTALFTREREVRREMRREILAGDKANQNRVAQLLDQALVLERQRLDLVQSEQREVAKFLSPVQRAQLLGLQGELRRRAQEVQRPPQMRKGGARRVPGNR